MLTTDNLVAFIPSRDLNRSRAFYGETLGLKFVRADDYAVVFDANGTTLRVAAVPKFTPHPFTSLGWTVKDLARTVTALKQADVGLQRFPGMDQDADGVWKAPGGARVIWFKDPDGNLLSATQP